MNKRWNILLCIIVVCVVIAVLIIKRDDLHEFVQTIQSVKPLPFFIAFCCLFGRYFSHAFAYKAVFRCVDEEVPYFKIVPLVFSVTFANDCAPTAGMAGSVLIGAWSHKQGLNMGKSVTVVFLEKIGFYTGFAVVMLIGFAILFATGQTTWYLILGAIAVLLMIATFSTLLIMGYNHVETEKRLFRAVERLVNKVLGVFHKKPMDPWAERVAGSLHEAARIVVQKPKTIVNMFCRMTLLHAFDCFCFVSVGFAFGFTYVPFLIASYVAGFIIATFILQTIGAVEILIALILGAYGATAGEAAAIALAYRGLIFWVPFFIGAICINITGNSKTIERAKDKDLLAKGGEQNAIRLEFGEPGLDPRAVTNKFGKVVDDTQGPVVATDPFEVIDDAPETGDLNYTYKSAEDTKTTTEE